MAWLINTLFSLLFGAVVIPLFAFAAGPVIGCAMVAAIVLGYVVVKRSVPAGEWRREYAWSFLAPAAGFFLSRRLRRRDEGEPARVAMRLTLVGAAYLYALSSLANFAVLRDAEESLARELASPARASAYIHALYPGHPLEALRRRPAYREQTPEQRGAIDAAWRDAQREYYRAEIRKRAPGKTLDETRRALRYGRLRPSQQAALDAAWASLPDGPDRSP